MKYKYTSRPILQRMYALFPIPKDAQGLEESVVSSYSDLIKVRSVHLETHDNAVLLVYFAVSMSVHVMPAITWFRK